MIRNLLKSSQGIQYTNKLFLSKQFKFSQVAQTGGAVQTHQQRLDAQDLKALAEEETQVLRESHRLYFQDWVNNQKTVFEAEVPDFHVRRYTVLFGLLSGTMLFMLYQGDFKYKYWVAVPALTAVVARFGYRNSARRQVPYVKEILLNKDGQNVNVVVSQNRQLRSIENVAIQNIKLHTGTSYSQNFEARGTTKSFGAQQDFTATFGQTRLTGVANDGYLLQIGGENFVAPYNHIGNKFALDSIWAGKSVNTANI